MQVPNVTDCVFIDNNILHCTAQGSSLLPCLELFYLVLQIIYLLPFLLDTDDHHLHNFVCVCGFLVFLSQVFL